MPKKRYRPEDIVAVHVSKRYRSVYLFPNAEPARSLVNTDRCSAAR